jgi:antirestriction protein ArdC
MHVQELYRKVTQSIIDDLERGTATWTKPWKDTKSIHGSMVPHNRATGRPYSGINVPILWSEALSHGYQTHEWLTYKQCQSLGAQVRKGETSTHIVFASQVTVKREEEEKRVGMLRAYNVFNASQVDNLPPAPMPPEVPFEARLLNVERFVDATGAKMEFGGNRACYVPTHDTICLPMANQFKAVEHYYATALHELVHWSGAKHRLDRDLSGRFKSKAYAAEELVAEFGAAFLCAHLGIEGQLRHADYIDNWLQLLKSDDRAIFTAASLASKASEYLRAHSEVVEPYD